LLNQITQGVVTGSEIYFNLSPIKDFISNQSDEKLKEIEELAKDTKVLSMADFRSMVFKLF